MGKNYFYNYFLQLSCFVAVFNTFYLNSAAQGPAFSAIEQRFKEYRETTLQEKIFVHTDKDFYLAGETVWFKIYYVDASFHQPLDISKLAYLEVLNKHKTPVLQTKVALQKGGGNGSLTLPSDIGTGYYSFRAYTNWMKNFDADFYFEKTLAIVNTVTEGSRQTNENETPVYDVQFFPEGGNLVSGIKSKLAFKGIDNNGKGIDFAGVVVNEKNDTVTALKPQMFGMGSFEFNPEKGSSYKAIISLPNNQQRMFDLPKIYEQGFVLTASENGNNIEVQVQANVGEGTTVYFFLHARNQVKAAHTAVIKDGRAVFTIDKGTMADGISHLTLFDRNQQPVCERLLFKRPEKNLLITTNTDKQQYSLRQKVTVDIAIKDEINKLQNADLSVAVYHVDSVLSLDGGDIASYLYLTSDLKGTIESPGYYLTTPTKEVDQALDNLMLTQGWRRFKWEDVSQGKKPALEFLPELEGHIVSARVVHVANNTPVAGIPAYLSIPGNNFGLYTSKTNAQGELNFFTKSFYGPVELVAQANDLSRRDDVLRIDIETPFSDKSSTRLVPQLNAAHITTGGLQSKSVNMQVQNIYTAGNLKFVPHFVDTIGFYGAPQTRYLLDDYVRFPTMEEVLREYVMELNVYRQNNRYSMALIKRLVNGLAEKRNPLVLIDGVPVLDDMNKVFRYDPLKVKQLDIINKNYFLGTTMSEGVVNFRTYTGRPEGLELDLKATVLDYEGLRLQREFYAPVYETENQRLSRLPDFRSLLWWSPTIKTGEGGKQQVSFYTSDLPGRYIGVIQGLSEDGRTGSKLFRFEVK